MRIHPVGTELCHAKRNRGTNRHASRIFLSRHLKTARCTFFVTAQHPAFHSRRFFVPNWNSMTRSQILSHSTTPGCYRQRPISVKWRIDLSIRQVYWSEGAVEMYATPLWEPTEWKWSYWRHQHDEVGTIRTVANDDKDPLLLAVMLNLRLSSLCLGFVTWAGDRLSWLRILMVFLSRWRHVPASKLIWQWSFFPHPLQLIIH
jgi:hypothetical protein